MLAVVEYRKRETGQHNIWGSALASRSQLLSPALNLNKEKHFSIKYDYPSEGYVKTKFKIVGVAKLSIGM